MDKKIVKMWKFKSESNPNKIYETLQYSDGTTSCGCPGWTRRAERTCKHTRSIAAGTADMEAMAAVVLDTSQASNLQKQTEKKVKTKFVSVPTRKVLWR